MKREPRMGAVLAALCIIAIVASASAAERAAVPVHLNAGTGTILKLNQYPRERPIKQVSVANPDIAYVDVISPYYSSPSSPAQILINGKKVGSTNLIVWDTSGETAFFDVIVSEESRLEDLAKQIKAASPKDDISVELANDTIVLSGHAKNQHTIEKVVRLAQAYAVASEIKTTTTHSGGVAKETIESSGKVINHIVVREAQQVLLEVRVAQLDKSKLKEFGLSTLVKGRDGEGFTNLVGAPSGPVETENYIDMLAKTKAEGIAGNIPGLSAITPLDPFQIGVSHFTSGIGAVLKALTSKGYAKVLAEPNLTVRSGEKGKFHVGTRYPIQTVTGAGANASVSIYYEEIGIRLNFAPTVLETGTIRLKIDPAEVSSITDFVRLENLVAPIIDARTVTTSVDLKEGESLILAGLLSEDMKKNISKIPLLGDVPILGALFRSTSDELRERELVFFITPKLVTPMSPGTRPELPGQKPMTPEQEREFEWIPRSLNGMGK